MKPSDKEIEAAVKAYKLDWFSGKSYEEIVTSILTAAYAVREEEVHSKIKAHQDVQRQQAYEVDYNDQ